MEETPACKFFSSGMAAISAAVLGSVRAGDHIVSVRGIYRNTYRLFTEILPRFGVETTFIPGTEVADFEAAIRPNTRVFFLESPSSAKHFLQDLQAVAQLAKRSGITTIIDNTLATPYNQKPRTFGIDIIVHSATKYLNGHGDVLAGAVCADEEVITQLLRQEHTIFGAALGPFEAWLILRGLRTFELRMAHCNAAGLEIARFLETHNKVARVYYPMLPSHPQYELACRQMRGSSSVLTIELKSGRRGVANFIENLRLFRVAVSWGGFESLAWPMAGTYPGAAPQELEARDLNPSMVRLFIGLENVEDLKKDLDRALDKS